jgi:proteasome beta subunit
MELHDDLLQHLERERPDLLPGSQFAGIDRNGLEGKYDHGTTIVAVKYADGAIIGGDTRSTMGLFISDEYKRKVHVLDRFTVAGFAGVSEMCDEYAGLLGRIFENYRKIHHRALDFAGKVNLTSALLKKNPLLLHGMMTVPILAGLDPEAGSSHIVTYDGIGGVTEKMSYAALGSGGHFAALSLRKTWRVRGGQNMERETAEKTVVEALWDSAVPQAGSSPPDIRRNILPYLISVDQEGTRQVERDAIARYVRQLELEFGDE